MLKLVVAAAPLGVLAGSVAPADVALIPTPTYQYIGPGQTNASAPGFTGYSTPDDSYGCTRAGGCSTYGQPPANKSDMAGLRTLAQKMFRHVGDMSTVEGFINIHYELPPISIKICGKEYTCPAQNFDVDPGQVYYSGQTRSWHWDSIDAGIGASSPTSREGAGVKGPPSVWPVVGMVNQTSFPAVGGAGPPYSAGTKGLWDAKFPTDMGAPTAAFPTGTWGGPTMTNHYTPNISWSHLPSYNASKFYGVFEVDLAYPEPDTMPYEPMVYQWGAFNVKGGRVDKCRDANGNIEHMQISFNGRIPGESMNFTSGERVGMGCYFPPTRPKLGKSTYGYFVVEQEEEIDIDKVDPRDFAHEFLRGPPGGIAPLFAMPTNWWPTLALPKYKMSKIVAVNWLRLEGTIASKIMFGALMPAGVPPIHGSIMGPHSGIPMHSNPARPDGIMNWKPLSVPCCRHDGNPICPGGTVTTLTDREQPSCCAYGVNGTNGDKDNVCPYNVWNPQPAAPAVGTTTTSDSVAAKVGMTGLAMAMGLAL